MSSAIRFATIELSRSERCAKSACTLKIHLSKISLQSFLPRLLSARASLGGRLTITRDFLIRGERWHSSYDRTAKSSPPR